MEEDDEDSDCLLIDEDSTEREQPVNANSCQLNDTASIANNEETIRNNTDTSPINIVSLLKNFNLERFLNNNPHIFVDSNEETNKIEQGKKQNKNNGARVFCKDFSRIPFDNASNLLTPEYLARSELYAHLTDNTSTRSAADTDSRNNGMRNDFRPTANNFTNNARRASETFMQIPNPTKPYYRVPQVPNTVYGNSDPITRSVNTDRPDVIGNANSIPLIRNGYGIRSEKITIGPAAKNLSHPGGPSTANQAVPSNVDRLNGLIINNCLPYPTNMDSYRPVSVSQSQELYASDANRRQMYRHDLAAPSSNYGPNIGRCQCACCTGSCPLINNFTPTSAVPTNYIPNRHCTCPEPCNVHRSGPLYPAQPNIQASSNFPTTAPRNSYGQALNGAIAREGLYRVEDPVRYANYQQAYLAEIRRHSNVAGQSTINTTRQHTANNIPGPAMNQKPKAMTPTNATESCAKVNTNHMNSGVINVAGFPAITASYQEATCFGNSNMLTNREAFGIKNTVKNKRSIKTIKETLKAKTKVVNKTPRGRPPKSKKNHFQLENMNIATTLAHKQNDNLQQPTVEMIIPTEHGEIKLAYNKNDTNIMQAPLSNELHLQNNMHNHIEQPQVDIRMKTIEQIIMDAVDMAMQNNVQQAENVTVNVVNTDTYKQDTLKRNVDSSVVLSKLNKFGASTSKTLTSSVVSASAKGFELRVPASFTGVEVIRDNIESIDLTSDSGMLHDQISMNIKKVQTPNTQQAEININSENAQIPLIMEASPQKAAMSLNTAKVPINTKLLPERQQADMNMTSNRVQTMITKEVYTTQQDNMHKNVEPTLASYMNNCETLTSVPQTSTAVIQASKACELEMLTSTASKDNTMNKNRAELESRINISNANSSTPLDRMSFTTNKEQVTIKGEHSKITNKENSKMLTNAFQEDVKAGVIITTGDPRKDIKKHIIQPAISDTIDTTIPTNLNQVKMFMNTETVPTSISTEASVRLANMNTNVESLQPSVHLNKNNLKTQITAPRNSETTIQQRNTCEIKVPALSSTVKEDTGLYIDKSELESRPNMTMQTNIQQTRMGSHTETVQTSISMETCTQQSSNNTYIKNALDLLTCVTQTFRTSNTCNLTYTTSPIESVTHNIENTDIASSYNNLNLRTGLMSSVPRSDTIYDTTQTQAIVQHHEADQTVDHISIDFLKSILHNVHRNATLQNTNKANTKSVHEPNTNQACNNNNSNTITDELPAVKEIKDHNEICEGTETIKNKYVTVSVSESNIISQKPKSDEESNKLKVARQHLALLNMQNKDVQSDLLEDNPQKSILDEYGSIISSVLKSVNISQTSYEVSFSKQEKSVDSCITSPNRVRSSANIKSLETRKRKIQYDREINKKESGSKKRYRRAADTKENNNFTSFSRPVQKPAAKTGIKLQRIALAKNQEKYKSHQYLVPRHHYEQKKFVHKNTIRSFAGIKSLRSRNRKIENDRIVTESVSSKKAVEASKKPYRCGADIKRKVKNNKIKKDTSSTSIDEILFFKFQIEFFRHEQERLMANNLRKSADDLSYEIYKLIYISENDDAKADIEFECPKCHCVSIYSPRLLYCKEDVHNLDESHKIVHCQSCIRFRKKYKNSFVRFVEENKKEFEKIIGDKSKNAQTDDDPIQSNAELKTHAIEEQLNIVKKHAITDDDIINFNNEFKTQGAYTRTHSDSTQSTDIRAINKPKIDVGSNQNIALKDDSVNSNDEAKSQSAYTRNHSDSTHSADIRATNIPKIDTGSNQNVALKDDSVNSNNESKTQSAYIRTHSDSTHSADIRPTDNRTKIDYEAIEEELNMITNGVPSFPTKAKLDVQNKYSKIKLPVKLSCQMLKPSIVESLIKLKHDTTIALINDIDDKNKNCVMNLEVQQSVSTKPVTGSRNKNLKTAIKKNDGNTDNNKECPVTIENANNNRNIDRSRKVSELNDAETTANINAKLPKINANNSTDDAKKNVESTCRVPQLINNDINTARNINDDNKKNKISSKVRKSFSIETATMCRRKINTGTNSNNKNNHKNCEARKNFRDDTANRPDAEPKPKNSIGDVTNKSSASYRVSTPTKKNDISMKLTKISGEHDKVESQRNDKDEENYKRDENRKSGSDSGNGSDRTTDDEINKTAKAIDKSFKTLKNNCNSNKKSELPQVHISAKEKSSIEPKNYATVKDEYTFKCHVCTSTFSYLRWYYKHMRNSHGIYNESIPEECVYKKCAICGSKTVQEKAYNTHIRTCHNTLYRIGALGAIAAQK